MKLRSKFMILLLTTMVFNIAGCSENSNDSFDYTSLYNFKYSKYEEKPYEAIEASYGYLSNEIQGYNSWYYLEKNVRSNEINQMIYQPNQKGFVGKEASLIEEVAISTKNYSSIRQYTSLLEGECKIYGQVKVLKGTGSLIIYNNSTIIKTILLDEGDDCYFEVVEILGLADEIKFVLEGDIEVAYNPSLVFNNYANESLYRLNSLSKYYGDVFPYYDSTQNKLYLYYLYTDNARDQYYTALEYSNDFFHYINIPEENNFEEWKYYKENGNLSLVRDVTRYIDNNKYTYGIRDNHLMFDEENNRYLLIAGCYYRFDGEKQTSDLVIYESNDDIGFDWNPVGNVVASYDKNLPECPDLMKIGDRWYAFTSVAYNTAHQVGPLQYWMGDKNQDVMDINFSNKTFSFLDGEDLCAARVFDVNGKKYMFGWIPRTYDTMPWAPWGGYLNLPREVVQRKDGTLGGRMDPALKNILNYGNIYYKEHQSINEEQLILDDLHRNIISFDVDLLNEEKVSYVMKQGTQSYDVSIIKENGKAYMQVASPNDSSHKINSKIEIENKNRYSLYIVNDTEFIEFFVDDNYALTAHTAMEKSPYTAYISASGQVEVRNLKIDKLIPYWNL